MSDPTHQDQDDTDLAKLHTEFFDLMSEFINLNLKSNGKLVEYLTGQLATRSENGKQAMASPVIHTPIKASKLNDKKSSTNLNPNDNKDKDDHSEGSTISGKIIELTSKYPEMFYHMQGPSKSLWQSLFEKFKSNLRDHRVESAILWICRLQTYSSKYGLLQPRFLQVWFCYFFDYYNLSEFDVNPSLDLLIATLNDTKVLCQQGLVKSSALAMITISQYSSLLNFVILNKMAEGHANEKMIRAYKMVKQLLFECRRPCIVTNRPAKVFRTLFPQIDKLEPRVQVEVI